jgi:hypothetical protein
MRNGAPYRQVMDLTLAGAGNNLTQLTGTTAVASTEYSAAYIAGNAIDGINAANSSWCTANNDPAPKITINFPSAVTVTKITILTSWGTTYAFLTGRFRVLNATGGEIHNSGVRTLSQGQIIYDVPAADQDSGARRLEFTGVTWNSIEPCLSEIIVNGTSP